jgi:ADP-heptose:LPS heptosyltransferase
MGSLVLAMPAVRLARETYPGAGVYFLVFANLAESVAAIGLTTPDRVFTIDPSSLFTIARDTWRFIRDARRLGIDTVVNLEMFARFGAILTFSQAPAAARVSCVRPSRALLRRSPDASGHLQPARAHQPRRLLTIVRSLEEPADHVPMGKLPRTAAGGLEPADTGVRAGRVTTDKTTRQQVLARLARERPAIAGKRLIVINPNASQLIPIRRWPIESYAGNSWRGS